jgi:aldehyde:ferredoxin oxidoreductase
MVGEYPLFEWLNAATGWGLSLQDYVNIGERILTLRHSFNVREGIKPADTRLKNRAIGSPPLQKGPLANVVIDEEQLGRRYYEKLDWDYQTGLPKRERLEKLGLDEVARQLYGK